MKLPREATLASEVHDTGDGGSKLALVARFKPRGVSGVAYWYGALPLHAMVFQGLLRGL